MRAIAHECETWLDRMSNWWPVVFLAAALLTGCAINVALNAWLNPPTANGADVADVVDRSAIMAVTVREYETVGQYLAGTVFVPAVKFRPFMKVSGSDDSAWRQIPESHTAVFDGVDGGDVRLPWSWRHWTQVSPPERGGSGDNSRLLWRDLRFYAVAD